jgi:hypothetical protein
LIRLGQALDCRPGDLLSYHNADGQGAEYILGAANYITAAICQLTDDQPARACTPMVRKLLGR